MSDGGERRREEMGAGRRGEQGGEGSREEREGERRRFVKVDTTLFFD